MLDLLDIFMFINMYCLPNIRQHFWTFSLISDASLLPSQATIDGAEENVFDPILCLLDTALCLFLFVSFQLDLYISWRISIHWSSIFNTKSGFVFGFVVGLLGTCIGCYYLMFILYDFA